MRLGLVRGRSTVEAIDDCAIADPHLHLALRVIRTIAEVGGASPLAIDRTAATLRRRAADNDERRVHAAQARLSAHVLTAVPLLMLATLLAVDPDVRTMLGSPVGAACIAAGLTANSAGWLWMRHLVQAEP
jgi:tight adherence protein B